MAVHVPLSIEAQLEARVLMMSSNNILSPASGKPIIVPSQDMVLGIYYLTYCIDEINKTEKKPEDYKIYSSPEECMLALNAKAVDMHEKIKCRMEYVGDDGKFTKGIVETTPGRIIVSDVLPKKEGVPFSLVNRLVKKKQISQIIANVASSQYGGCTADRIDEFLAPYAELNYKKHMKDAQEWVAEDRREDYARTKTKKDIYDAMQSLEYEINTLFTSNGQTPFTSLGFGLGTNWFEREIQKAILTIRIKGLGSEHRTAIFPKLIFTLKSGLNLEGMNGIP